MRAALTATALAILGGALAAHAEQATRIARIALADANGNPANVAQTPPPDKPSLEREPPLIAYALEIDHSDSKSQHAAMADLRAIDFEMSRHPPPSSSECSHTLGAARFANQYSELASIQFSVGDFEAAIRANESALACSPRDASLHASIASANLSLGRIDDARTAIDRGNAVDPEDPSVREVRARVDFVQERWADATARFRLLTLPEESDDLVDYHECFFWLAQRRAGMLHPELPPVRKEETLARKRWPVPILDLFKGDLTEGELVQVIRDEARGERAREQLTEALYYVGELRLAEGDVETARKHFASVVNLRVLNFVEFGMARAELARMRERGVIAEKVTSGP